MPRIKKTRKGAAKRFTLPPILKNPSSLTKAENEKRADANRRRSLAMRKHDWDFARNYYLTAERELTLRQVAEQLNLPYQQLRAKAGTERWRYLRAQEQARTLRANLDKHLKRMATESIKFDETALDIAKLGLSLVAGRLAEIAAQFGANEPNSRAVIDKLKAGQPIDRRDLYSVINYKELRELAQAGQSFQDIGKVAAGTNAENINLHVSGEVENIISVASELGKDDPGRLAAMLEALERAGLAHLNVIDEEPGVINGEVLAIEPAGKQPTTEEQMRHG